jgi:La-related protein 7
MYLATSQVEFYFSDINLATTEHLMKFITKDPDGFGEFND